MTVPPAPITGSTTLNFSTNSGKVNVGEQIAFYVNVMSWSVEQTVADNPLGFDESQGASVQLHTGTAAEWDSVDVSIDPAN